MVDDFNVFTSTHPAGGPGSWTRTLLTCGFTCTTEEIQTSDRTGLHTVDTLTYEGEGTFLTGLKLTGDTLSWSHAGTPRTLTLTP